jgi:hypothetical protein
MLILHRLWRGGKAGPGRRLGPWTGRILTLLCVVLAWGPVSGTRHRHGYRQTWGAYVARFDEAVRRAGLTMVEGTPLCMPLADVATASTTCCRT